MIHQFHGTRYVAEQIFSNFLSKAKLKRYSKTYIENADEDIKKIFESFNHVVPCAGDEIKLLGKGRSELFDYQLQSALDGYFE